MSKKFWENAGTLESVNNTGGGKVAQDYFGMHKEKSANSAKTTAYVFGERARNFADETERRRLNLGGSFQGTLVRKQLRHLSLYIAHHSKEGLCIYVDQKTSRSPEEIEIYTNNGRERKLTDRGAFFGDLSSDPISEDDIDNICRNYERKYILTDC